MEDDCPHLIKAVSISKLKKELTKDKGNRKPVCTPCKFNLFDTTNHWCCLQCGQIYCGDENARDGDAAEHSNSPRSDLHCVFLHLESDSRCWCFQCKMEVNARSGHLREAVACVKRNVKFAAKKRADSAGSVAIPLPPPIPKLPANDVSSISSSKSRNTKNSHNVTATNHKTSATTLRLWTDKPAGLSNLGNTCFMNSALQCLASTRKLLPKLERFGKEQNVDVLLSETENEITVVNLQAEEKKVWGKSNIGGGDGQDEDSKSFQLSLQIGPETMTSKLWQTFCGIRKYEISKLVPAQSDPNVISSGYGSVYRPGDVHDLLSKNFRRGAQHDSHELLRTILDMMKKDQTKAFRVSLMKRYGVRKGGEGSDPASVELVKKLDEKLKHKTFVDEVFGGELMTTQTCLICNHIKRSHEQFLDLSLPLRVVKHVENTEKKQKDTRGKNIVLNDDRNLHYLKSLEDCLRYFTEPELLTGSNVVECENCHRVNLEKITAGMSPEEVFPILQSNNSEKTSKESSPNTEHKVNSNSKKDKKKRASRQAKIKSRLASNNSSKENEMNEENEKEVEVLEAQSCLPIVENHFQESDEKDSRLEDEAKKNEGDTSSQTFGDYVVINSEVDIFPNSVNTDAGIGEVDLNDGICTQQTAFDNEDIDEIPPLLELQESQGYSNFASSKNISESLQDLNVRVEGEEDEQDDLDLSSAVDGVGGSASDVEEEFTNGTPRINLDLPSYDKFDKFQLQQTDLQEDYVEKEVIVEKPITADEGFSEGSMSELGRRISQGPSGSSSRNSLSDSDENSKSSSNDEEQNSSGTVPENPVTSKIPKVTKCPCSRQQSISRPPENLTIHFKRFEMSSGGFPLKITANVTYPMILDLTPFCSQNSTNSNSSLDEEGQVLYALYGIVEHSGSMNFGHYIANVKSTEDENRWFYISDASVNTASMNQVMNDNAYILFYERIRGEEKTRRLSNTNTIPAPIPIQGTVTSTESIDWSVENWLVENPAQVTMTVPEEPKSERDDQIGTAWEIPFVNTDEFPLELSQEDQDFVGVTTAEKWNLESDVEKIPLVGFWESENSTKVEKSSEIDWCTSDDDEAMKETPPCSRHTTSSFITLFDPPESNRNESIPKSTPTFYRNGITLEMNQET